MRERVSDFGFQVSGVRAISSGGAEWKRGPGPEFPAVSAQHLSRRGCFLLAPGTRNPKPPSSHFARAFSLIELIIVMALIGIMTAVIIAEMKGTFEDALLRSTARSVIGATRIAHSQSAIGGQPHRLRLDFSSGTYEIEQWRDDPVAGEGFSPIRHVPGAEGAFDPRILIELRKPEAQTASVEPGAPFATEAAPKGFSRDAILFQPDGTAERAEILLRDRTGAGIALRVNPATSRVRIIELEPETQ